MGYPMARNLLKAGHEVAVWSNTGSKATQLAAEAGAKPCATPAEVAADAEVVFVCVGNTEMAETVITGENGLKSGGKAGMIVVDASTIGPSSSVRIANSLAEKGIEFLGHPARARRPARSTGR